ncbi:3-phosphoshikimate 1-carboxyvinyltransferase [Phragmitibacter flavus]|uniref:3-phosphoshikimate 1-carboxyvinyltransferase n=1 Tax=Phragmitibacter flavus TaxID=2576071 RepID=A0A5R8KAV0_9BACT|nr:3-phosphoshikimate 1-carboxyvinyltransferase [Phragmitibacter flavus]TLD69431.1 3-phosphoshikimate 1-carboxyvinyltransferase [Phragmitibacter flavus]
MSQLKIRPLKNIPAEIIVPGDKSISHRSVMFAALCEGQTLIENFLSSEDCLCSLEAMKALGAECEVLKTDSRGKPVTLLMTGHGMKLREPLAVIDCGNSGTTMRLLSGILAAQNFKATMTGDESLQKRPMKRVAEPLEMMGAKLKGQGVKVTAPLTVKGGELRAITYPLPVASAQVKSAVLLAGWNTFGKTTVIEPEKTRDHTERLLAHFGVKVVREGNAISIYGGQKPEPKNLYVPGDISSAAFWMVAAAASPDSMLVLKNVGLNPTRTGVINVLVRMGAHITDAVTVGEGEPRGNVVVRGGETLRGTVIGGAEIPNVIDELPILAVAAALAQGKTIIKDAAELRVKETDRIAAVAKNLRLMGVPVEEFEDGMEITGGQPLIGAELECWHDHRIAMAFAIAGLFAEGTTTINGTECIATSYPGFEQHLEQCMTEPLNPEVVTKVVDHVPFRKSDSKAPSGTADSSS